MNPPRHPTGAGRSAGIVVALSLLLLSAAGAPGTAPSRQDAATDTVIVFAAAGTALPVRDIARLYQAQTGRTVVTHFAASSTLARQIVAGAPFDVFLSANAAWMDTVAEKQLIAPDTRRDLLADRLVLIAAADAPPAAAGQTPADILVNTDGPVAVGDPMHVPVGLYTKEALAAIGCWDALQGRLVPAHSVRAAQQYVETGDCPLGIVYRAVALQTPAVRILHVFEESLHTPIRFSAAAAAHSRAGRDLLVFLRTPAACAIFRQAGLTPLDADAPPGDETTTAFTNTAGVTDEWQALWISVKVAVTCVLVVAAPGILLGYLLACKTFPGRSLIHAVVCLPMVIPPVVTGYLALLLLGRHSPLGGFLHRTVGISFAFHWWGAVFVAAVMGFPLLVRSVKAAMEMVDDRYRLAAHTLGAAPWRTFVTVTLPLAAPGILAGLVLAFARSLGEFGATAVFVGSIPGRTQTLSLAIYNFMQIPGGEAAAMRLVAVSLAISLAAMIGAELLLQRMKTLRGVRR